MAAQPRPEKMSRSRPWARGAPSSFMLLLMMMMLLLLILLPMQPAHSRLLRKNYRFPGRRLGRGWRNAQRQHWHLGYHHQQQRDDKRYDLLILSQSWPPSACYDWESTSPNHSCNLPKSYDHWTIHGLWPTRNHTIGPAYCNENLHFDVEALEPLRPRLDDEWLDVHGNSGSSSHDLWRHEWQRHGTCAIDLTDTSSEALYFGTGLKLFDAYNLGQVLAKENILPSQSLTRPVSEYLDAIKRQLGKNAYLECMRNKKGNETYLHELRICFNKQFKLIDCDAVVGYPTNCDNLSEAVLYPSTVPAVSRPGFQPNVILI